MSNNEKAPPQAAEREGLGGFDGAFERWFDRTSLGNGDRGFASACFLAGFDAAYREMALAPSQADAPTQEGGE